MQREDVLGEALKLLECNKGLPTPRWRWLLNVWIIHQDELRRFWPDKEAILYDALRYLSQQIDVWRRQLMLDETQTAEQSCWHVIQALSGALKTTAIRAVYFIAACTVLSDHGHPIHQLADQQKARPTISPTNC